MACSTLRDRCYGPGIAIKIRPPSGFIKLGGGSSFDSIGNSQWRRSNLYFCWWLSWSRESPWTPSAISVWIRTPASLKPSSRYATMVSFRELISHKQMTNLIHFLQVSGTRVSRTPVPSPSPFARTSTSFACRTAQELPGAVATFPSVDFAPGQTSLPALR